MLGIIVEAVGMVKCWTIKGMLWWVKCTRGKQQLLLGGFTLSGVRRRTDPIFLLTGTGYAKLQPVHSSLIGKWCQGFERFHTFLAAAVV